MQIDIEQGTFMIGRRLFAVLARLVKTLVMLLLIFAVEGCSTVHYTESSAPIRPEDAGRFAVANPEIPIRVQIANFEIRQIDTQYSELEKDLFRRHNSVAIPNLLQEFIGKRQVFAEVSRVSSAAPGSTDYIITGTYDFFERLGTQGREWIPGAGTFGAHINEATVKGILSLRIVKSNGGTVVLEKAFPEEHSDNSSIYVGPKVGYLQEDYMGRIASEVINSISNHRTQ